jgi:uncharacterized RDD family membrane protein YckC
MNSVHQRTARFLNPIARRHKEIVTPEGVALTVELADYGERVGAFMLDFLFLILGIVALVALLRLAGSWSEDRKVLFSLVMLLAFLVRTLYFVSFELAWRGVTPGKRIVGLRVIDRHGGPLMQNAIVARNLMRELEAFMPLGALASIGGPQVWERLALAVWLMLFALLPFLNRDRMRGGDLLAGTIVIAMPKRRLLEDLVEHQRSAEFSDPQLRAYGAFELQILEELLRRRDSADTAKLRQEVCERICRKIAYPMPGSPREIADFLRRFYTAERAFLEREQLYGRYHEDKESLARTREGPPPLR